MPSDQVSQSTTIAKLVGIGVSVWDSVMRVPELPEPGGVSQATTHSQSLGGGISVGIATAARFGSDTAMIDSLGDDESGWNIQRTLRQSGVDCSAIQLCEDHSSSLASIWTDTKNAERTIVFYPGSASNRLRWNDEIDSMIRSARILHLNGRHLDVCHRAIEIAKRYETLVSFDGGAHRYRDEIVPLFMESDIAIVAKHFAMEHWKQRCGGETNLPTTEQLAHFLIQNLQCEIAGVTDGARGSFLIHRDGTSVWQQAIATEKAIDTTGCGDTYHGAFLHAYLKSESLSDAAEFAANVASKTAQRLGGFQAD